VLIGIGPGHLWIDTRKREKQMKIVRFVLGNNYTTLWHVGKMKVDGKGIFI
jgi:hypothetical protein